MDPAELILPGSYDAAFSAAFVLFPLFFLGVVALIVVLGVRGFLGARRRREAVAATVAAHHLGHLAEDPARASYFSSPPFGLGRRRRARDVVWGTMGGRPFETFAYSYETESRDTEGRTRTTTHTFQVTWVPLPAPLPTVRLTGDNAMLRALGRLGGRDLDTESHEFNQRWKVQADDERVAHAILTPRMIERLLGADLVGRAFVIEGSALYSYAPSASDLAELPLVVGALHELADGIPAFLFEGPREADPAS
ncbi:DUF3137 domain-containing protein [Demequina mangrovi]|uniref:DUF3137 domain-containing protein n=1 Tax=Demequina mangrovi TaxID=1043493 RepID=A0A1H7A9L1_9MICO|nr:DUF3137 domain-containing protein [Demequina mangrovi]SEJ61184.1 Protein of unknown function [Demequina mangrovi]